MSARGTLCLPGSKKGRCRAVLSISKDEGGGRSERNNGDCASVEMKAAIVSAVNMSGFEGGASPACYLAG